MTSAVLENLNLDWEWINLSCGDGSANQNGKHRALFLESKYELLAFTSSCYWLCRLYSEEAFINIWFSPSIVSFWMPDRREVTKFSSNIRFNTELWNEIWCGLRYDNISSDITFLAVASSNNFGELNVPSRAFLKCFHWNSRSFTE